MGNMKTILFIQFLTILSVTCKADWRNLLKNTSLAIFGNVGNTNTGSIITHQKSVDNDYSNGNDSNWNPNNTINEEIFLQAEKELVNDDDNLSIWEILNPFGLFSKTNISKSIDSDLDSDSESDTSDKPDTPKGDSQNTITGKPTVSIHFLNTDQTPSINTINDHHSNKSFPALNIFKNIFKKQLNYSDEKTQNERTSLDANDEHQLNPFSFFTLPRLGNGLSMKKKTRKFLRNLKEHSKILRRFIIDTDCAADDALAILTFLGLEESDQDVKLDAITVVAGQVTIEDGVRNALRTLSTVNRADVPVYKGDNSGLTSTPSVTQIYGKDGFSNANFSEPLQNKAVENVTAAAALINIISKNPGKISLICLGPLTNIAIATKFHPNLLNQLQELFILGGSKARVRSSREYNFRADPIAANIVLTETQKISLRVTLLPIEPTIQAALPMQTRIDLGRTSSKAMKLINEAESELAKKHYWNPYPSALVGIALMKLTTVSNKYDVKISFYKSSLGVMSLRQANNTVNAINVVNSIESTDITNFLKDSLNAYDF